MQDNMSDTKVKTSNKKNPYRKYYKKSSKQKVDDYNPPYDEAILASSIDTLSLPVSISDKLRTGKVETLCDVLKRRASEFYRISTFNKKDLTVLTQVIKSNSLDFRPEDPNNTKPTKKISVPPAKKQPNQENDEVAQIQTTVQPNQAEVKKPKKKNKNKKSAAPAVDHQAIENISDETPQLVVKTKSKPEKNKNAKKQPPVTNTAPAKKVQPAKAKQSNNVLTPVVTRQKNVDIATVETEPEHAQGRSLPYNARRQYTPQQTNNMPMSNEMRQQAKPSRNQRQVPNFAPSPDIYIKVSKKGKWGFMDRAGNTKVQPQYDEVFTFKEDICCVEREDHFGYINREGEEIIPLQYECALSFSEGLACVFKNGKCGYIDKTNTIVVNFEFDAGTSVVDGSCRVKKDTKWGALNISNPHEVRWII